jgi:hypothetical protein
VVPKNIASEGYLDLDRDDYKDGDFVKKLEIDTLAAVEIPEARSRLGARQAGKEKSQK